MKIGFFGCSFTEGGGFNSPIYVDYAIKNNIIDISELDKISTLEKATHDKNYPEKKLFELYKKMPING